MGSKLDQSAYHSELAWVLSVLIILNALVYHQNITDGSITIVLDRKSTLNNSGGDWPMRSE